MDQIKSIAKQLRGLGRKVDLPRQFGFLTHWQVIAPFDNTGRVGFDGVFPPEEGIDLSETYDGKSGPVTWQPLFGRDEYHRGMRIDQYRIPVQLEAGKNTILIKACQNEQTEEWTVQWQFQMRVCDASGTAILAENRRPTPEANSGRRPRRPNKKEQTK